MLLAALLALLCAVDGPLFPSQPSGRVNDYAGVLSAATRGRLEALLAAHESRSSNQLVIVTLGSLEGQDIADVGYALGQAWKIGQKGRDNGVVFLIAPRERRMRLEVGKGLEGALTDLETSIIQEELVKPLFLAGDFDGGVQAGAQALVKAIEGEFVGQPRPVERQPQRGSRGLPIGIIIALVLLFIFFPRAGMVLIGMGMGGRGGHGGLGGGFRGGGGGFGGGGSSSSW